MKNQLLSHLWKSPCLRTGSIKKYIYILSLSKQNADFLMYLSSKDLLASTQCCTFASILWFLIIWNGFGTFHCSKQEVYSFAFESFEFSIAKHIRRWNCNQTKLLLVFFSSRQETELLIPFFYLDYHDIVLFMEK